MIWEWKLLKGGCSNPLGYSWEVCNCRHPEALFAVRSPPHCLYQPVIGLINLYTYTMTYAKQHTHEYETHERRGAFKGCLRVSVLGQNWGSGVLSMKSGHMLKGEICKCSLSPRACLMLSSLSLLNLLYGTTNPPSCSGRSALSPCTPFDCRKGSVYNFFYFHLPENDWICRVLNAHSKSLWNLIFS